MFQTIGVCGTGNMGRAIVKGLVAAKAIAADHIYLYNIHREKPKPWLKKRGPSSSIHRRNWRASPKA